MWSRRLYRFAEGLTLLAGMAQAIAFVLLRGLGLDALIEISQAASGALAARATTY